MAAPAPTSPFVMHGARDALAAGLAHIEEQVRSIELAVIKNPALAFDLARTLVETVCRTILADRKIAYGEDDDLPKLFKMVSNHVSFLPVTASGEAATRNSLKRTLGGLNTAIHGICELRNQCGFASHGPDKARPAMEAVQALMAAEAADTIVGFLHRVHRQDRMLPPSPQTLYDSNKAFNDYVDETFGSIRIFESEFRASEVLFQIEPESYRIYLAEFDKEEEPTATNAGAPPGAVP
jgi:hypothetical protein